MLIIISEVFKEIVKTKLICNYISKPSMDPETDILAELLFFSWVLCSLYILQVQCYFSLIVIAVRI